MVYHSSTSIFHVRRFPLLKTRIALIGYGALSRIFLNAFEQHLTEYYELNGIYSLPMPEGEQPYRFYDSLDQLLADKPDMVVEFAGGGAVRAYGEQILNSGCSLVIASVGALADDELYARLRDAARANGCRLHLPSGAIGGFDLLRTLSMAGTKSVSIESRKPPKGLNGAPYLNGRELSETEEELVFEGTSREAIAAFPKNVNVAVATALAAADVDTTCVKVRSVPGITRNTHTIRACGDFAEVTLQIASIPDPANPKSSTTTAWSVAALLLNLVSPVQFF